MYVLHNNDGAIIGVVTGDKNYGVDLTRVGHQWIYLASEENRIFNFDSLASYVDIEKKNAGAAHPDCLVPRVPLTLSVDKETISADGIDVAHITGIPAGSAVRVTSGTVVNFEGQVDDGEVELTAVDPITYDVTVVPPAKYLPASIQVIAR